MHKNGRPLALGDTVPVMKEMKEKNLHRTPRAPRALGGPGAPRQAGWKKSVSYQLLENERKKYHLFHPLGGRVRPPEKPKNKSIILVKLLFHRKRKVSSRRFGVRNLTGAASSGVAEKNERKMYHFPETRMHKNARPLASGHTFPVMKEMKEKNLHRAPQAPQAPRPTACLGPPCKRDEKICILSTFRK
jgi:hypothetical protein